MKLKINNYKDLRLLVTSSIHELNRLNKTRLKYLLINLKKVVNMLNPLSMTN